MRILLDVDEVLLDSLKHMLHTLNVDPETIEWEGWDVYLVLEEMGYSPRLISQSIPWWKSVPEVPGAFESIQALRMMSGVEVIFLTSLWDAQGWFTERVRRLTMEFGARNQDIIFAGDKSLVDGDVFVDDKAEALHAWKERHPHGRPLLFDALNNQPEHNYKVVAGLQRVMDWEGLLEKLLAWHQIGFKK